MKSITNILCIIACVLSTCSFTEDQSYRIRQEQRRESRIELRGKNRSASKHPLEWPALKKGEVVFEHVGYSCSYNRETLISNWVAYELTDEEVNPPVRFRGRESFRWDPETKGEMTAYREDYRNDAGWQRGHLAPRADMRWSVQAYEESFFLSNICPQNGDLNSKDWEATERLARRMATRYGSVYVVCGPIVGDNKYGKLGEHGVVIPDAFFKVLLVNIDGVFHSIAMVLPNEPTHHDPNYYWCTVDELEKKIGMDFFPGLENKIERACESVVEPGIWGR